VTGGEKCEPEGAALFLVASTGSDLLFPFVLGAELVDLAIRKPVTKTKITTTRTPTTREQTYIYIYV